MFVTTLTAAGWCGSRAWLLPLATTAVWVMAMFGDAAVPASAQGRNFVIASNGDPYEAMWRKSLVPTFEKMAGTNVVWSAGLSAQTLAKIISQRANPQIDVAFVDEIQFVQGLDLDLWEPLTKADLGDTTKVVASALAYDRGIAYGFSAVGLYYNTEIFRANTWEAPTSWMDLLRPEFQKKITMLSLNNSSGINTLIALNDISGGKTPENMDPGFLLAKRYAQQALTIDNFGDTPQLIQQKAAVAGIWIQQRIAGLAESGVPIKFVEPKEGSWGHRLMATIVKGRPVDNTVAAKKLLALMLTKEQQLASTSLNPLPVNTEASGSNASMVGRIHFSDQRAIQKYRADWVERWSKEIERR
jgi:putative spermidine/putrescine transport system substrate-binding protein